MVKLKRFFIENKFIFFILISTIILRLIFFNRFNGIWWDSAVYIGMAKSMFGTFGFWEFLRPIGLPFIFGIFWKLGLDVVLFGRIFEVFCNLGIIYLVYLIGKKIFDKKVALIASFVLAFNALFFFLGFRLYSSIPATFFILFAYYLILKRGFINSVLAGFLAGFAMLIRYPVAVLLVPLSLKLGWDVIKRRTKSIRRFFGFNLTAFAMLGVYLYYNYIKFGDAFISLKAGLSSISTNHGVPILITQYDWFYIVFLFLFFNFLLVFFVSGLYHFFKKMNEKKLFFVLIPMLIFGGFLQLFVSMREERYTTPILFAICLIIGLGFVNFKFKKARYVLLALYLIVSFSTFGLLPYTNDVLQFYAEENVPELLEYCSENVRVASSSPLAAVHWNNVQPYYGAWTTPQIRSQVNGIGCIFYSSCDFEGEFPLEYFKRYYDVVFYDNSSWCEEYVLRNKNV